MTDSVKHPAVGILWELITQGESQTIELGRRLGRACRGGEILLLDGPLGAGKTCLTGGIAQGMGITEPAVSPSYVILRSYLSPDGLTLHHLDFYRLAGGSDLETVGVDDCLSPDAVVVTEWPGRCPDAFDAFTLAIQIHAIDERRRRLSAVAGTLPIPPDVRRIGSPPDRP